MSVHGTTKTPKHILINGNLLGVFRGVYGFKQRIPQFNSFLLYKPRKHRNTKKSMENPRNPNLPWYPNLPENLDTSLSTGQLPSEWPAPQDL